MKIKLLEFGTINTCDIAAWVKCTTTGVNMKEFSSRPLCNESMNQVDIEFGLHKFH